MNDFVNLCDIAVKSIMDYAEYGVEDGTLEKMDERFETALHAIDKVREFANQMSGDRWIWIPPQDTPERKFANTLVDMLTEVRKMKICAAESKN